MSTQSKAYTNYQTQRVVSVSAPEPVYIPQSQSQSQRNSSIMSFDLEKPEDTQYRETKMLRLPLIGKDVGRKKFYIAISIIAAIILALVIIGVAVGTTAKPSNSGNTHGSGSKPTTSSDTAPSSGAAGKPVIKLVKRYVY